MHANFSTAYMREVGGKEYFEAMMKAFEKNRDDHIAVYGPDNHMLNTIGRRNAPMSSSATSMTMAGRF